MDVDAIRRLLLGCALINYAFLIAWFLAFRGSHQWLYALHRRWFQISVEQFDGIHYLGMAIYKIGIILFNLAPLLVLYFQPQTGH